MISHITYLVSANRVKKFTSERALTGPRCSRTAWKNVRPDSLLTKAPLAKRVKLFTLILLTGTRMIKSVLNAQKAEMCTLQFVNLARIRTRTNRTGTRKRSNVKPALRPLVMKIVSGTRTHKSVSPAAPASHQT